MSRPRRTNDSKATSTPTTGSAPSPPSSLRSIEEAEAWFEEASDHVRRRAPFESVALGPTVPVPLARLEPGTMGWSRTVSPQVPGRGKGPDAVAGSATLYYVLLPSLDTSVNADDLHGPLNDAPWSSFAYAEPVRGSPRAVLLLEAKEPRIAKRLRPLAEAVRAELESEPE